MPSPADRAYTDSHEWHKLEPGDGGGGLVTVGLTAFAVNQLTDVTYVEMKPVGSRVEPGGAVGEVESVKTTSDVYSAVGGEIVEVNPAAVADPSLLNSDPYGKGWLVRLRVRDASPLASLFDAPAYDAKYSS